MVPDIMMRLINLPREWRFDRVFAYLLFAGLAVLSGCTHLHRSHGSTVSLNLNAEESRVQQELSKRGYGMFVHFGINTLNQTEWSDGKLPAASYHPTQLDPDSWVRIAKQAGFRHVVLVTKHHDGFCLWDSAATDYDVAGSPVPADVVEAVARACRKYAVQLGLYYSLWDRHEPRHQDKDPQKYVAFNRVQTLPHQVLSKRTASDRGLRKDESPTCHRSNSPPRCFLAAVKTEI